MAIETRSDAAEIRAAASVLLERMQFMRQAGISFHGMRDLYEILGFSRTLSNNDYRARYARGGIAKRIVDALPKASWRGGAELVEKDTPKSTTAFEKAWEDLEKRLHIWATLLRSDILAGLSTYSVVLIGAPGNLSDELPKGKPDSLLYLTPFSGGGGPQLGRTTMVVDADATIQSYITDSEDERFGLPEFYQLRRLDITSPAFQLPVHWTRIVHVAEGCLDDEIFGQPRLEACWNDLDSLDKVIGGGAEAFWLRANQGIQLDVDKDMTLNVTEKQALKDQADEYQHQMRRMLRTRGVTVTPLGSDVANFSNPADAILTLIAGTTGIPKRVLTGSEMGSLASEQDRDNWADQVNARREGYCGPNIVRPLVDRLIKYGYLPTPKEYNVVWPEINTLTAGEKAAGALSWAQTNSAQGMPVFTSDEVRDFWYAMDPLPKPKTDAEGNPVSEDGQPLAPTHDPKTGLPIKVEPPPVLGKHPISGLPVEVDTKTGKPAAANKKPFPRLVKAETHSYSSTQINLPWDIAGELRAFAESIDNDALAPDGIEYTNHITVKYGIHTNDAEVVAGILAHTGPIHYALGPIDCFTTPDYDVLLVRVVSVDLVVLNARISQSLAVTDTHPTYQPHVTLAYLQPGQAKPFLGDMRFVGRSFVTDTVLFSSADDVVTPIRTLGEAVGHPFHGNQWTDGPSYAAEAESVSVRLHYHRGYEHGQTGYGFQKQVAGRKGSASYAAYQRGYDHGVDDSGGKVRFGETNSNDLITLGSVGSGNFGHVGQGNGKEGGSGPSMSPGVQVVTGDFDWASLGTRRFMLNPANGEMIFGQRDASFSNESHAEEFATAKTQLGATGTYDQHMKGWVDTGRHNRIIVYGETGAYLPGGRDNPEAARFNAIEAVARRFIGAGAPASTVWQDALDRLFNPASPRTLGDAFPELYKPYEYPKAAEAELLHVLEAAILANNTDVIDGILGIRHARFNPDEPRDKDGKWTDGDSLDEARKGYNGPLELDRSRVPKPRDYKHSSTNLAASVWHVVGQDSPHQNRFLKAFEHIHGTLGQKSSGHAILAALTGFGDLGKFIGLSEIGE